MTGCPFPIPSHVVMGWTSVPRIRGPRTQEQAWAGRHGDTGFDRTKSDKTISHRAIGWGLRSLALEILLVVHPPGQVVNACEYLLAPLSSFPIMSQSWPVSLGFDETPETSPRGGSHYNVTTERARSTTTPYRSWGFITARPHVRKLPRCGCIHVLSTPST